MDHGVLMLPAEYSIAPHELSRALDHIWSEPKPLQRPHPPVIIGGDARQHSPAPGQPGRRHPSVTGRV
jgi:hypothetical protein